jgi:hypothetical protein
MSNPQNKNSRSISISLSLDNPDDLAHKVLTMFNSGTLSTDQLTDKLGEAGFALTLISGAISLVADLGEKASLSQKQHAQDLANGLQSSLQNLQQLGSSLESDQSKVRFAEIVASLSKDYFATVKALSEDSNNLWKYAIGGAIAVAIGVIGGKEYLSDRSTKNS